MIHGRDIVCVASNWSESPTGKHHIMRRLARENRVLWINYHASRRPRLTLNDARHAWARLWEAGQDTNVRQMGIDGVRPVTPLLLPWPESSIARTINGARLHELVHAHLRDERPCQLWLFTPDAPEIIPAADWERVVYCCVDEFSAFGGVNPNLIESLERKTLAGTDVVLATSRPLYESRRQRHANVHLVVHGVDFEHFARARELRRTESGPAELRGITWPILGYFGLIADYVDVDLLARVARERPHWTLALLGDVKTDVSRLSKLPNVRLLGRRDYSELPEYCARFDVGLIPFRAGRLTAAVNPIKLREYLAAGLPVISAPMAAVERYQPAVRFAATAEEFLSAAEGFLTTPTTPKMRSIQDSVRTESWDARVAELSKIVLASAADKKTAAPAGAAVAISA